MSEKPSNISPEDFANDEFWLVWSNEHSAWWAPHGRGYVRSVEDAGRFTYLNAIDICSGACFGNDWTKNESSQDREFIAPNEVMVPSPEMISVINNKLAIAKATGVTP